MLRSEPQGGDGEAGGIGVGPALGGDGGLPVVVGVVDELLQGGPAQVVAYALSPLLLPLDEREEIEGCPKLPDNPAGAPSPVAAASTTQRTTARPTIAASGDTAIPS